MVKGRVAIAISLGLGVLAFFLGWSGLERAAQEARIGWNPVPVIVANVDIPEGTLLTTDMIARRSIPEQFVTASVVKPDSASLLVGQRVVIPLQAGDPMMWSQFETNRAGERLANKVQVRGRAVTITAAGTSSVGGWVRPNDRVDILGTLKDPETGEQSTTTLLQNVVVLATGHITGNTNQRILSASERQYTDVSLLVSPEEAEVLTLAQELGALTLTLRNDGDGSLLVDRRKTTIKTLFDGERLRAMREARPDPVVIIRGTTQNEK